MVDKSSVDYSVYLVTDQTPAILGDKNLIDVVRAALQGGASIVQYREKKADTGRMIAVARELHRLTREYKVPLLINDRVDVALAVDCEGVHIGQDDMDLWTARKLLGSGKIIGVTVSNVEEAVEACKGGADYLGIGTVYATPTKTNTKSIIGAAGVREILQAMTDSGFGRVKTVCIGGMNETNISRILFQSSADDKSLDGVAVVSALMAAEDPKAAAENLRRLVLDPAHPFRKDEPGARRKRPFAGDGMNDAAMTLFGSIIQNLDKEKPISHNMTNLVVQNIAANVALAIGASPIMANYGKEAADLCKLNGALVVNMGTVDPVGLENYLVAVQAYNGAGRPVVFDPVGAGATSIRREAVKTIMAHGYLDVIKGNASEIEAVYAAGLQGSDREQTQQRGVDGSSQLSLDEKVKLVQKLAAREKNVVVMTGERDIISDGRDTVFIDNGHEILGTVTGTGCCLGTAISAALALWKDGESKLSYVMAAMLLFEIAAEVTMKEKSIGPGSFVPAFIDNLDDLRRRSSTQDYSWLELAKIGYV